MRPGVHRVPHLKGFLKLKICVRHAYKCTEGHYERAGIMCFHPNAVRTFTELAQWQPADEHWRNASHREVKPRSQDGGSCATPVYHGDHSNIDSWIRDPSAEVSSHSARIYKVIGLSAHELESIGVAELELDLQQASAVDPLTNPPRKC